MNLTNALLIFIWASLVQSEFVSGFAYVVGVLIILGAASTHISDRVNGW